MEQRVSDLASRVSALEARQLAHERLVEHKLSSLEEILKETRAQNTAANAMLSALNTKITRYEGKFGGIILAIMSVWAFITGLPQAVWDWIKRVGGTG